MKDIILNFPKQFKAGIEVAKNVKIDGPFSNVIFCGVGGSALPGSLLLDMDIEVKVPIFTHKDYGLPKIANEKSLIVAVSFSGNTEETISSYEESIAKGYKVATVCTGGKLERLAKENNKPVAVAPNDCGQPRFGTGYLVGAVLTILANAGIIENKTDEILKMASALHPDNFENQGKGLANKLVNKIPVVYSANQYKQVARAWKIKLNENSKAMAFWNYFPELNHNEMVGLTNLQDEFHFLILKDPDDRSRNVKRMELFAGLAKEKGVDVDFIEMAGTTKLEKIFNSLLLGDWTSFYLAQNYGIDPVPVAIVEDFKKRLG